MKRRQFTHRIGAIAAAAIVPAGLPPLWAPMHRTGKEGTVTADPWPKVVAGIRLIDSPVAKAAVELAREVSPPLLLNHVMRTYLLGALAGKAAGLRYDEELLYLACVLHDLGLTPKFAGDLPFEIEGAIAAERFLRAQNIPGERAAIVWDGIAMHPLAIAQYKRPEIALVAAGAAADVVGAGLRRVGTQELAEVLHVFPRLGFKRGFVGICADTVRAHPKGATRSFMRDIGEREVAGFQPGNICDAIAEAPFDE